MRQGLCNGTVSVRLSVRLSVYPVLIPVLHFSVNDDMLRPVFGNYRPNYCTAIS